MTVEERLEKMERVTWAPLYVIHKDTGQVLLNGQINRFDIGHYRLYPGLADAFVRASTHTACQ